MDLNVSENSSKLDNFIGKIKKNFKIIIVFVSILLLIFLFLLYQREAKEKQAIKISNEFNVARLLIEKGEPNDAKEIFELAVIYKYLSKSKRNSDWIFYSDKLKETLRELDLSSEKNDELTNNESEIIPLIDSIKDLVTEIPESGDDK